jgi:hypothetical protein
VAPLIALLGLCLLAVTLCYAFWCSVSPWGTCTRCRPGKHPNRTCRACNGTGMRPRLGWQAWTHLRRLYKDGTR